MPNFLPPLPQGRQFVAAVLLGSGAVFARSLLDPFLEESYAFILAIPAVVAAAWYGGLWPGLVCLLISFAGSAYFIVPPRHTFAIVGASNQFGAGLFILVGFGCALLGEAQQRARRAAERNYRAVVAKQVELAGEVERRNKVEEDLRLHAGDLAIAQRRTADTLALLDTFVHNTPVGLAFFDPDLRYVLVNRYLANANRMPVEAHLGRPITEVQPGLPATVAGDLRSVLATGQRVVRDELRPNRPTEEVYRAGYYPVRSADGSVIGVGAVVEDVTDKVRAERVLKASERRFRELAESLPQLVWTCRADGPCDYLSRQWEEYTGRPAAEQLGSAWAEAIHPDDRTAATAAWRTAVAAGTVLETEFRIRRHDGMYRWFYTRAVPVRNAAGQIEQWFGTNTDIQSRRETEEALRESEANLSDFFENGPIGLHLVGPDGTILRANRAELDMLGYSRDEYVGRHIREFHADETTICDILDRLTRGEVLQNYEARLRCKDGSIRHALISSSVLWRDGRFAHTRCFTRDITDRMRAEEELRESQRWLQTLSDAMPQIVWAARPDGRLDYFNARWHEFTGFPPDHDPADGWAPLLHADDREPSRDAWAAAVMTGSPFETECRFHDRQTGDHRWFLVKALPARDETGRLVRWFGSCTDIHAQKTEAETLERLVAERTTELKRSNEELEQFAYVASHDLQEPLRKVQAFGDLVRSKHGEALGAEARDYLDRMIAAAGRMRQLIQDLLGYSRVGTKGQPFTPVDLNEAAAAVLVDFSVRIEQVGGTVDVGQLPTIDADPMQMRQLLQNLIGNALKFHRPDTPPVVTVRAEIEDGDAGQVCRLTVADNGIGFDEKYLDRIFQVFQRLHGRGEYEGTGVGLALCRKIAERHGGEIIARSTPGAGSTFIVTLPVRRPSP